MYRKIFFLVLAFALLAIPTGYVYACSGNGCNGTWPDTTGCASDAYTVRQKWPYGNPGPVKLELRRSDFCSTFWARSWNYSGFTYYVNATLKNYYWNQRHSPTNDSTFSPQRFGTSGFQACGAFRVSPAYTGPVSTPCTSVY